MCVPVPTLSRPFILLGALLVLPGCDMLQEFLGDEDKPPPRTKAADDEDETPPDLGDGAGPPEPLVRAERKLRFPGKSGEHMGFDLARLSKLQALAGAIEVPEWSDPGQGTARMVRDDDLRTAWVCELAPEQSCAIGIHFPRTAEVDAIRLFAATPAKQSYARPKVVRIHTDEGWAEAKLANEDGLWSVQLGEPVRTRNLTVEVMEAYDDAPVHLAELEIYGRNGTPRPPLTIDLSRRVVSFQTPVWRKKSRTHTAGKAFAEQVDVDGRLRRLFPGTALIGRPGARLLLLERADWSTCNDHQGTYSLLDTQTRVMVPLGDMGGFAGQVFAHTQGLGFAMGRIDGDDPEVQGAVLDGASYERRSISRLERREPRDLLAAWDISDKPLERADALPMGDPPTGCEPAEAEVVAALLPRLPRRTKIPAKHWRACTLGSGASLLLSTGGSCGKEWHMAVVDAEGELVEAHSGKHSGSHFRLRRVDQETILVEHWGNADDPRLFQADEGSLVQVEGAVGFSMRPPVGCRKRCDIELADLGPGK
ncbi:MAG: hypothetical protein AAGF11_05285 [Myxococcota bacterium]